MNAVHNSRRTARTAALIKLEKQVLAALTDMKAVNIKVIDVRGLTDVADTMIVASGNSDRHVRSIADNVIAGVKGAGRRPMGVEGARDGEWVLVDLTDVLVHIMLPRVREFYALEQLWEPPVLVRTSHSAKPARKRAPVGGAKRAGATKSKAARRTPRVTARKAGGQTSGKRGPRR